MRTIISPSEAHGPANEGIPHVFERDWPDDLGERLDGFYRYWLSKKDLDGIVRKKSIHPWEIKEMLPYLMIIEALPTIGGDTPWRFHYRLAGTEHLRRNGLELTGRWLDEVQPKRVLAFWTKVFTTQLASGIPGYCAVYGSIKGKEYQTYKRVMCPISLNGTSVDALMGCFEWTDGVQE